MTIGNAQSFIVRGIDDSILRNRLNAAATPLEITKVLSDEKLMFSEHDFYEAFHHQLTLYQEEEKAEQLKDAIAEIGVIAHTTCVH